MRGWRKGGDRVRRGGGRKGAMERKGDKERKGEERKERMGDRKGGRKGDEEISKEVKGVGNETCPSCGRSLRCTLRGFMPWW
jgi:hypothetical protein